MEYSKIKKALTKYNPKKVYNYILYLKRIEKEKKRGKVANPWFSKTPYTKFISLFAELANEGLYIDGQTIYIAQQYNQIAAVLTYHAYKNKVLMTYPETTIDVDNVYKGDVFSFKKEGGKVFYTHQFDSPFRRNKSADMIGCYCVIKNRRGEFIEFLTLDDIKKMKDSSKMGYIWDTWFSEMTLKSVLKRACKRYFYDLIKGIYSVDNKTSDPSLLNKKEGKATLADNNFQKAIKAIQKGEFTAKKLLELYSLTDKQKNLLDEVR